MWRLLRLCNRAYHEGGLCSATRTTTTCAPRAAHAGRREPLAGIPGDLTSCGHEAGREPKDTAYIAKHFAQGAEVSDTIDGVGALWYRGVLYGRGDGVYGNVMRHRLALPAVPYPVRGEVVLPKDTPRGNLRARVAAAMHHQCRVPEGAHFVAHGGASKERLLRDGFRVPHWDVVDQFGGLPRMLERRRERSPYRLDGLVVRDGQRVVSFKTSTVEPVPATVAGLRWKLTKAGNLFPVIELAEPAQLGDMRARTLPGYSAGWIRERGIGPGARIEVLLKSEAVPVVGRVLRASPVEDPAGGCVEAGNSNADPVVPLGVAKFVGCTMAFFAIL